MRVCIQLSLLAAVPTSLVGADLLVLDTVAATIFTVVSAQQLCVDVQVLGDVALGAQLEYLV